MAEIRDGLGAERVNVVCVPRAVLATAAEEEVSGHA